MAAGAIIIAASASIASGFIGAEELKADAKVAEFQARSDARASRIRARQSIRKGNEQQGTIRLRQDQLRGAQLSNFGAQGIDPRSGTVASTIIESRMFGDFDAIEVLTNAKLEALGHENDALSSEHAGRMARLTADRKAQLSILGGFLGAGSTVASFAAERSLSKGPKVPSPKPGSTGPVPTSARAPRTRTANNAIASLFGEQKLRNAPTGRA